MNVERTPDDVVDRALRALLDTPGPERPPDELTARLRQTIASGEAARVAEREQRPSRRGGASWRSLALTLALMVAAGWGIGSHRRLLSEVGGRQLLPDGTSVAFYTDGRVVVSSARHSFEGHRR